MAKGGGGAWKVAYADFVTAMMAFFLVMWICAQDQQVRQSVAHYFVDPFSGAKDGVSKRPSKTGSLHDARTTGTVPESESAAMGQGRSSYTTPTEASRATKWVSDWITKDAAAGEHWRQEARRQRERARGSAGVGYSVKSAEEVAAQQLARQMKEEFQRDVPPQATPLQQDLLFEAFSRVNWHEIAEDLLAK